MGAHRDLRPPAKRCFAYTVDKNGHEECSALRELFCRKEKCKFYKCKDRFEEEKEKYGGKK